MVGGEDLDDKSVPLVFGLCMSLCGRCAGTMISFSEAARTMLLPRKLSDYKPHKKTARNGNNTRI